MESVIKPIAAFCIALGLGLWSALGFLSLAGGVAAALPRPVSAGVMDETEVSIGDFAEFAEATGFTTKAEREGGQVFGAGWETMEGWNWRRPYGIPSPDDEPAVHITYDEAEAYCAWRGKRLPSRGEWIASGYTEMRENPPKPFERGVTYPYPTGDSPMGANCLDVCGVPPQGKTDYSAYLDRGAGHARVGTTRKGVNGLYDMGANVWEWARIGDGSAPSQATMGGSWWYGAAQMRADYGAVKPRGVAVVYIGFRCFGG